MFSLPYLAWSQSIKKNIINEWSDSRYTDNGDGTVTDKQTSLMWSKCSLGQDMTSRDCTGTAMRYNWQYALEATDSSILVGYNDWRLPNIEELASLVALDRYNPAININIFPNTPSAKFWSASPLTDHSVYAWLISFDYGRGGSSGLGNFYYVRLVRSEQ